MHTDGVRFSTSRIVAALCATGPSAVIVALCGGFGAARFVVGLASAAGTEEAYCVASSSGTAPYEHP
jgi:hypothetical protein